MYMRRVTGTLLLLSLTRIVTGDEVVRLHLLGDRDFFGFPGFSPHSLGQDVPSFDFDNRTEEDPEFTDHDARLRCCREVSDACPRPNDLVWAHDLSEILEKDVEAIPRTLGIGIGGIQDGNQNVPSVNDRLFVEHREIPGAFDELNQGPLGTGWLVFDLSGFDFDLSDGQLDVEIRGGRSSEQGWLDSYFVDFSRVVLQGSESHLHVLGDEDFFGFSSLGQPVPYPDFDNRSPDDHANAPFTDHDARCEPPDHVAARCPEGNDLRWQHDLTNVLSGIHDPCVTWTIGFGGIQDGAESQHPGIDDRLFIQGIEVPDAFDKINHGDVGTGEICIDVTGMIGDSKLLEVEIRGGQITGTGVLDSYFVDFSQVRIHGVLSTFKRGDINGDGTIDVSDAVYLLNWLFLGGPEPTCLDAADVNDSSTIPIQAPDRVAPPDISDAPYLLNWLFLGGPPPPPPGAVECGPDPTEDNLSCASFEPCP